LWCATALAISSGESLLGLPRCRTSFAIEELDLLRSMDFSFLWQELLGRNSICKLPQSSQTSPLSAIAKTPAGAGVALRQGWRSSPPQPPQGSTAAERQLLNSG
jgi:hypothetical protein